MTVGDEEEEKSVPVLAATVIFDQPDELWQFSHQQVRRFPSCAAISPEEPLSVAEELRSRAACIYQLFDLSNMQSFGELGKQ